MKLALGTVQFGLPYGVANKRGKPDEATVAEILYRASRARVRVLDTAYLYGDSEAVLGRCLSPGHSFNIVTKTPKFVGMAGPDAAAAMRTAFDESCARLRAASIYGLLAHDADDLLGPAGDALWRGMTELRAAGRISRIGASVYSGAQIDRLLQRYPIDLVQLPLSLLDQRLVQGGQLERLKARGVEIHARSAFLQGALLMPVERLPVHLAPLRPYVERVAAAAASHGIDTLSAALRYVAGLPQVAVVVCGVDDADQFDQLVAALGESSMLAAEEATACACNDAALLDPSQWRPA